MEAGQLATPREISESLQGGSRQTRSQSIADVAGLIALVSGLIVLAVVAVSAMAVTPGSSKEVAVGAFGVIGSAVGAYFGLKVGAESAQKSIDRQSQEAAKAQVFAAHVPDSQSDVVIQQAHEAARAVSIKR